MTEQSFNLETFRARRDAVATEGEYWACGTAELLAAYAAGERNFRRAVLREADLSEADLREADLRGAVLRGAVLREADLSEADLSGADLRGAVLRGAGLSGADLREADLSEADLSRADLSGAGLSGADLRGTCLDPAAPIPNTGAAIRAAFDVGADGHFIAYRTRYSQHVGNTHYTPGEYIAPIFSVSADECHPGLYFAPLAWLQRKYPDSPYVRVRVHIDDALAVGDKFRCRKFTVLGGEDES